MWLMAILFGMLYAVSDELHQWFVEGRSCELRDVGIDTTGVILGTSLYRICHRKFVVGLAKIKK